MSSRQKGNEVNTDLDIETVPDAEGLERAGRIGDENDFRPWPLHRIECVSLLSARSDLPSGVRFALISFSGRDFTERSVNAETERVLAAAQSVLTLNGRGFDIPSKDEASCKPAQ
jgi:hypothetical protein